MNWSFILLGFLFGIELQSSYIDRNRRIYAISTVIHTRWPGNNGGLLTTLSLCTDTRVTALRRCAFEACAFMLKGTRFMPRTVHYTVKTNALKKKNRVVVLIRKIILPLISLLSKLNVAIYLFGSPDLNLTPLAAFLRFCRAQRGFAALGKKRKQAARGVRFKSGLIYLGELSVGHKASSLSSFSSLSFSMISTVVMFQHVEKVFPDWCFSLTLFRKHFFNVRNVYTAETIYIFVYIIASTF